MTYCTGCGSQLNDDLKFCTDCGTPAVNASNHSQINSHAETPTPITTNSYSYDSHSGGYTAAHAPSGTVYTNNYIEPQPQQKQKPEMGIGSFLGGFLLMCIPVIGLIVMIVWACGSSNPTRASFARAALIFFLIVVIILATVYFIFKPFFDSLFHYIGNLIRLNAIANGQPADSYDDLGDLFDLFGGGSNDNSDNYSQDDGNSLFDLFGGGDGGNFSQEDLNDLFDLFGSGTGAPNNLDNALSYIA